MAYHLEATFLFRLMTGSPGGLQHISFKPASPDFNGGASATPIFENLKMEIQLCHNYGVAFLKRTFYHEK